MSNVLEVFQRSLKKLGIETEFALNWPWIYLRTVNGKLVTETFQAQYGFTAFWAAQEGRGLPIRFTDRKRVFAKVREMINE